jgi:sucrose-6-phosphate hydrolase SacC (GH32 family)
MMKTPLIPLLFVTLIASGGASAEQEGNKGNEITPATYKAAPDDILVADFEGDDNGGWKAEGEAFGPGPRVNRVTGFLGKKLINSYLKGDTTTGTLTSPPFKIERKHINFLIGGGNHPGKVGMQLIFEGKVVRSASGPAMKNAAQQEIMDWHSWDVSEFAGKTVTLQIIDQVTGGWGHTLIDHIFQSNNAMSSSMPTMAARKAGMKLGPEADAYALVEQSQTWDTFPLYAKVGYDQSLRPQFHFTSRVGWLNEPNGMVYYDGDWLMAFQHFAKGNASGAKSWGQAVSKDLMHWTQLPHAINPYPNVKWAQGNDHAIWSGSAIVDQFNALGKQEDEVKTIFAMFTATHAGEDKRGAFFQVGAYSTDKGRTWTKINDGKPLIDHLEGFDPGQRDPYLFFHAPTKSYRFIMEIGGPEHAVRIWKSSDLMNWATVCDIPNKSAECINMYSVPVDGDPKNVKWVIANAGTGYEVGDFDGTKWTGLGDKDKDGRPLKFEYGDCYYAAQTFNQAPDHRVVHVGWLRTGSLFTDAGMPFTQQLSIPAEITLRNTPDGLRMFRNPVKEIATLYAKTSKFDNLTVESANAKLATLNPELIDMTIAFVPAGDLTLNVRGLPIQYDAAKKEFTFNNTVRVEKEKAAMLKLPAAKQQPYRDSGRRTIPAQEVGGKVTLRVLVDRASLELFVNDGQAAASFVVVPDPKNRALSVQAAEAVIVTSLEVNELKSAWAGK